MIMANPVPSITVAAPPTISETALTLLQYLTAGTGIFTDFNIGGIARTYAEGIGSVDEQEAIIAQAQAFQAMIYGAYAAFNIYPYSAVPSTGTVTFSTLSSSPTPSGVSILIPTGTIVQSTNGIQFSTSSDAILVSGTTSISVGISSLTTGVITNVSANTITQIVSALTYPLSVNNSGQTNGGSDAELPSQTLGRFTSTVDSIGLGSPLAIAAGVLGVTDSSDSESVMYSVCYEQWISQAVSGDPNPTPGFIVIIDGGNGTASDALVTAVSGYLSTGGIAGMGLRPAGVPYSVQAVVPTYADINVTAAAIQPTQASSLQLAITQAVNVYFNTLNFGDTAELSQTIANVANVSLGQLSSLSVLMATFPGGEQVSTITPAASSRVVINTLTVTVN